VVQKNKKIVFYAFFGHLGPLNGPKKIHKGPQVGGMYGPMSKLKNKPLTKALGPFFQDKWSKSTRKTICEIFEKQPLPPSLGIPDISR
jgi:hypothetical protein